jgi:hypothetical protein
LLTQNPSFLNDQDMAAEIVVEATEVDVVAEDMARVEEAVVVALGVDHLAVHREENSEVKAIPMAPIGRRVGQCKRGNLALSYCY